MEEKRTANGASRPSAPVLIRGVYTVLLIVFTVRPQTLRPSISALPVNE